ncbi:unnamed protein product [Arctia plantaginis]|uniref:Uncharacterized protein n=1 Tax=Arctia plantaginis TaxID=874455 RepID=A0A8S1B3A3_ARCPL|nr:unnamed protein product [Arctia plantaginis]
MPVDRSPPAPVSRQMEALTMQRQRSGSEPSLCDKQVELETLNVNVRSKRKGLGDDRKDELSLFMDEMKQLFRDFKAEQESKFEKMISTMVEIQNQNKEICSSAEYLSKAYDSLLEQIKKLEAARQANLEHIQTLEQKLEIAERYTRSTCIEIRNMPAPKQESKAQLLETIISTAKILNVPLQPYAVRDAFHIQSKNPEQRPIIGDFTSVIMKEKFIYMYKVFKKSSQLTTETLNMAGPRQIKHITRRIEEAACVAELSETDFSTILSCNSAEQAATLLVETIAGCKKCKLFLSINKDDVIRCKGECNSVFHRKCVKNMKQFLQKECCEECSKSALAVLSPKITEQEEDYREHTARPLECPTAMEDLLREVNKKLEIVHKMDKDLEDIKNSVSFYAEKYQEMVEFKQQAEKKMKSMEQQQGIPEQEEVIVIGDMNIDLMNKKQNVISSNYKTTLCGHGLQMTIPTTTITREAIVDGQIQTSCIDHVWARLSDGESGAIRYLISLIDEEGTVSRDQLDSYIQKKIDIRGKEDKARFDQGRAKVKRFQKEDIVLFKANPRSQIGLDLKYPDAYVIWKILPNDRYQVKKITGRGRPKKVAHDQLRIAPKPNECITQDDMSAQDAPNVTSAINEV